MEDFSIGSIAVDFFFSFYLQGFGRRRGRGRRAVAGLIAKTAFKCARSVANTGGSGANTRSAVATDDGPSFRPSALGW